MTGPIAIIKPFPAPWLGLEGDDFFGLSPTEVTSPFLSGRLSFPSLFRFTAPLPTTLGADDDASSLSFFLHSATDALTKALCLVASISVKDEGRALDKQTERKQQEERSKEVRTYINGSICLVYGLQVLVQDHHSRRAACQE